VVAAVNNSLISLKLMGKNLDWSLFQTDTLLMELVVLIYQALTMVRALKLLYWEYHL
jgi:hypothetical protein